MSNTFPPEIIFELADGENPSRAAVGEKRITGGVPIPSVDDIDHDTVHTGPYTVGMRLVCVAGPELGTTYRITKRSVEIGRGSADVALRSTQVSRSHARITQARSAYTISDAGSSNGTFVNGVRISSPVELRLGDRIQVGTSVLVFAHHDELEQRMRQVERLEAMGTLAGGLAHDFNNSLLVILSNLEYLGEHTENAEHRAMIDEIAEAAKDASKLARRLLKLGRSDPASFHTVRLSNLIVRAVSLLRRQAPTAIRIEANVEPGLTVLGAQDELMQVAINLFVNARDAMPDGGEFVIAARAMRLDASQALSRGLVTEGDYVEIAISDTGCGMDDATLARIYEPFFTTKGPGRGTGLGLAMVHNTVRSHGGSISVTSVVDRGTTFRIVLPAMSRPPTIT